MRCECESARCFEAQLRAFSKVHARFVNDVYDSIIQIERRLLIFVTVLQCNNTVLNIWY